MKHILILLAGIILFSSCIKQLEKAYQGQAVAEIDATPLNSNAVGVSYPVLTRIPVAGRPASTTLDSTLRRFSKTIQVRINLVGPQSATDQTVGYKIITSPITTIAFPATITGQTPTRAAATLPVTDAVAGTHYTALSGKVTIPANSSFGFISIDILEAAATTTAKFIGIELDETGTIKPSVNYSKLGLVIDQR